MNKILQPAFTQWTGNGPGRSGVPGPLGLVAPSTGHLGQDSPDELKRKLGSGQRVGGRHGSLSMAHEPLRCAKM